jgi:hypothetical protein
LKLRQEARKEVEQEVAREEDDHEGIEDGDGDDGHEYETNEGGAEPMDAGGKKNSRSRDKHPEADAVIRKVARKDDDHDAIDDEHGGDYQEYDTSEGGRGHIDTGGKKNSRSRDKHPEAEAVTATNKTRSTSKVQARLNKVQRMKKRAKKKLVASVVAQVLAAQNAKKKARQARIPNGQEQLKLHQGHEAHGRLHKQTFTTSGKRSASDANTAYAADEESTWDEPPPRAPKRVRITTESIPNNRLRNWTVAMRRNFKPNTITEVMRPWELSRERFDEVTPC